MVEKNKIDAHNKLEMRMQYDDDISDTMQDIIRVGLSFIPMRKSYKSFICFRLSLRQGSMAVGLGKVYKTVSGLVLQE